MYLVAKIFRLLFTLRYKITIKNGELMKQAGAKLFLPNHQALVDPQIVVAHVMKFQFISPVLTAKFYNIPILKWMFQWFKAVPVADLSAGNRDPEVLNFIYENVEKALEEGRNVLLYPAGQLTNSGLERIHNKQSAWLVTQSLPANARVIGVRMYGLWGSMWSRAKTGKTPRFIWLFMKASFIVAANLIFFVPKRKISMEFEDITEEVIKCAALGRKPFNEYLEEFYNKHGEEPLNKMSHYFFIPNQWRPK